MRRFQLDWWWSCLVGLVLILALGTINRTHPELGPNGSWAFLAWLSLLLTALGLIATLVVHELGHLLADVVLDFDVAGVWLGSRALVRTSSGWRVVRSRNRSATAGPEQRFMVSARPRHPDHLRARHAAAIAAGPLAALSAAGGMAAVAAHLGSVPLGIAAAASALVTPYDLVAGWFHTAGRWSDSRWLVCWLREPEIAVHRLAIGTLTVPGVLGRRPRDWAQDERWISLAGHGPRPPSTEGDVRGCQLAYYAALDRGLGPEALRLAARTFAHRNVARARARPLLAVELAFCLARFSGDTATASRLLDAAEKSEARPHAVDAARARAAVQLAQGQPADALETCEQALALLPRDRVRGLGVMSRELVEAMRDEALAARRLVPGRAPAGLPPAGP